MFRSLSMMSQTESSTVYRVQCTALQQPAALQLKAVSFYLLTLQQRLHTAALQPHRDLGHRELLGYCISRALQRCSMWAVVQGCCSELQLQCDTLDTSCPAAAAWSPHMCCSAAVLQSLSRPLIQRAGTIMTLWRGTSR